MAPRAAFYLFWALFRHNFAKNGHHDLKMAYKDASGNSTQSVIKSGPKPKINEKVTVILVRRSWNVSCQVGSARVQKLLW